MTQGPSEATPQIGASDMPCKTQIRRRATANPGRREFYPRRVSSGGPIDVADGVPRVLRRQQWVSFACAIDVGSCRGTDSSSGVDDVLGQEVVRHQQ